MSIFDFFRSGKKTSADAAQERLQIVLAYERKNKAMPDFLPKLQQELIQVVRKYVTVGDDQVDVNLDQGPDCTMLEVNIELPSEQDAGNNLQFKVSA